MKTKELPRRPPGRPYLGNKKVTFKLSPALVAALTQASAQLGLNKSELTEKALSKYLGSAAAALKNKLKN